MKGHRAAAPSGQAGRQIQLYFIPTMDFEFTDEVGRVSAYVKDLLYTVRTPDLQKRARAWEQEGRVKFTTERPRIVARGKLETK